MEWYPAMRDSGRASSIDVLKPYSTQDVSVWRKRGTWLLIALLAVLCLPYGFFYALFTPYLMVMFVSPVAILAALVIWALPDLKRAPTGALAPLAFTFLTALILWPNYLAIALPGLPWITMIRLTAFPLTLVLLVCTSISAEFRQRLAEALNATPVIWKALFGLAVIQCLSIAFSSNPVASVQKLIVAQTAWTAVFFASVYVFLKPGRVERWAIIVWLMALIVGTLAILEARQMRPLWGAYIPNFLKVEDEVVQRILAGSSRSTTGQYRTQATFSTALGLSEYCALAMPFVLHFAVEGKRNFARIAAALTIPFLLYVILLTDARLGLLGFFLTLMGYLFLWAVLRWAQTRQSLAGPATVLVYPILFLVFAASSFLVGRIRTKVWGTGQYNASNLARMNQAEAGLPMILDHPAGHGIGQGSSALGYTNAAGVQTIDSYFLLVGLDVGILGLVAYLTLLGAGIVYAVKYLFLPEARSRETRLLIPLAVCVVNFAAIKVFFANDDNHPLIFMVLAAISALVYRVRLKIDKERPTTSANGQ